MSGATVSGERSQIPVTSLASLKRAIQQGATIRVLDHWQPNLIGTTRKAVKVQTNGYWFYGPDHSGKSVRMWAEYPKAAELRFNQEGTVTFHPNAPECRGSCIAELRVPHRHKWTLRFEQESLT